MSTFSTSEKAVTGRVRNLLDNLGAWHFKVHGSAFQDPGIPDVLACYKGTFIALEVKKPGEKPTKLQQVVIEDIQAAGGVAGVVSSENDVRNLLAKHDLYVL